MYKTIRHGENSLQYTILPQNDDFRIECKLSSASSSSSSSSKGHSSNSKSSNNPSEGCGRKKTSKGPRRPKRRSFFAYLGLIFVCTVIVGAVLIPFLVSAECLPNPTEWFLKTKAALIRSTGTATSNDSAAIAGISRSRAIMKETTHRSTGEVSLVVPTQLGNGVIANVGKAVKIINRNGVEKVVVRMNTTGGDNKPPARAQPQPETLTEISENTHPATPSAEHLVTEVRFKDALAADRVAPTIVVTTLRHFNTYSINEAPVAARTTAAITTTTTAAIIPTPAAPKISSTSQQGLPASTSSIPAQNLNTLDGGYKLVGGRPKIGNRIIQVPLLKAAFKTSNAPATAPSRKESTDSTISADGQKGQPMEALQDSSAVAAMNLTSNSSVFQRPVTPEGGKNWMHTYWPYIDPSNYFQWSGYKAEDSVLLPALLGFALIGVILIIMVCMIVRNKRTIVSSVRKRNRNDVEETGAEDNATLLATANLSDDD